MSQNRGLNVVLENTVEKVFSQSWACGWRWVM